MPVFPGLQRAFCAYTSDDGNQYAVPVTQANQVVSSAGWSAPIDPATLPAYPRGWQKRIVYGVDTTTGARTKVPFATPGAFQAPGATFTKNGITFVVEGLRGEHRFRRS